MGYYYPKKITEMKIDIKYPEPEITLKLSLHELQEMREVFHCHVKNRHFESSALIQDMYNQLTDKLLKIKQL